MVILESKDASVRIDEGELVGYVVQKHEYIHQKGSPGWRSSDTEMFPVIGPTSEADFQVQTPRDIAIQDQHGLLREMDYKLVFNDATQAVFQKTYIANTRVKNSKFPTKSTKEYLFWPYDFTFTKRFKLNDDSLEIIFQVEAPKDSPFMLGYHPAFKLHSESPTVRANRNTIALKEILAVGNRAFHVADCDEIQLNDKKPLQIKTEGFGHFMLWTPVINMLCIEPITFYPYTVQQQELHKGFTYVTDTPREFKVVINVKADHGTT